MLFNRKKKGGGQFFFLNKYIIQFKYCGKITKYLEFVVQSGRLFQINVDLFITLENCKLEQKIAIQRSICHATDFKSKFNTADKKQIQFFGLGERDISGLKIPF